MYQKIVALFLCIILSLSTCGCGKSTAHSGERTVKAKKKISIKIPVLIYHHVTPMLNEVNLKTAVTPNEFAWQMNYLDKHKYRVISLKNLYDYFNGGKISKNKLAVITFDDGYEDNYKYAYPILKKHKFPATIFLIANKIGGIKVETGNTGKKGMWNLLKLSQIKEMKKERIEFGAHTLNHINLINVKRSMAVNEIYNSKKFLEKQLKAKVYAFSYPYGNCNVLVKNIVRKAGYKLAVNSSEKEDYINTEPFNINRIDVGGNVSHKIFLNIFK